MYLIRSIDVFKQFNMTSKTLYKGITTSHRYKTMGLIMMQLTQLTNLL